MGKTLAYRLFGLGKVPKKYTPVLEREGVVLLDEGIRGSITLKRFKSPGRWHSWKRSWFTGCLVLTERTFAAFAPMKPLIFVPLADKRFSKLRCGVETGKLLVAFDASLFNVEASGIIECRFKTDKAQLFLEHLLPVP